MTAFTRLYIQFIFAVGDADSLLTQEEEPALCKHLLSWLRQNGHSPIIAKGSHDHIHVFTVIKPDISVQSMADLLKNETASFIHQQRGNKRFTWQEGYGAFSYSKTRTNDVYLYIQAQERFHSKRSFREEFVEFMRLNALDFDPAQLPKGFEEFEK